MTPEERRNFVGAHRTAILGYARRHDGPALSAVYYVTDGDEILVSTPGARAKTRAIARNPKVSLCVLDEKYPPSYVTLFCDAVVDEDFDLAVDVAFRVAQRIIGAELGEEVRPFVADDALKEKRVTLRLTPYATYATPPRHGDGIAQPEAAPDKAALPWGS
ncbi:pyridoxamine 5'-phosphate oxidase-related FMN-binding [Parafrankia sp. EAN1pec]|uniref:pyridoxamine 5'-phosphate oxidase family protein n=1 Tax=Parafrankia sp. (strain EAN1pec) TaxID=298653 RepID=UPI0000540EE4|nr:pyridoxamine 5'-phosphate oxidase-related FMN-binding [Frankia sp. EAN1pec]